LSIDRPNKNITDASDVIQFYRPIAIRSVIAAQVMMPRLRTQSRLERSATAATGLPIDFRSVSED